MNISSKNLPKTLPIFPLNNFIIFPKTTVPLNIFEPRYIEMINDSMKSDKLIGMIQPKILNSKLNNQDLHNIGCLGKITNFEKRKRVQSNGCIRDCINSRFRFRVTRNDQRKN